jgi:ABC-2 type transport system ATP-binding protein
MAIIETFHLSKFYKVHERPPTLAQAFLSLFRRKTKTVEALKDVNLTISEGECVGILGPNGAGKTTLMKLLTGLLYPSSGTVTVLGKIPWKREKEFLRMITFVAGQKQLLLWDLPPMDTFLYQQAIYRIPDDQFRTTLDELVQLLEAGEVIKKPTRRLSLGERMKCELIASLLHRPRILFLDEPTLGLDVHMQQTIRNSLQEYVTRSKATLLLTSHNLLDLSICPRILLIYKGELLYDGSLEKLLEPYREKKRIILQLRSPLPGDFPQRFPFLQELADGKVILDVPYEGVSSLVQELLKELDVEDLRVEDPPLERLVAQLFLKPESSHLSHQGTTLPKI